MKSWKTSDELFGIFKYFALLCLRRRSSKWSPIEKCWIFPGIYINLPFRKLIIIFWFEFLQHHLLQLSIKQLYFSLSRLSIYLTYVLLQDRWNLHYTFINIFYINSTIYILCTYKPTKYIHILLIANYEINGNYLELHPSSPFQAISETHDYEFSWKLAVILCWHQFSKLVVLKTGSHDY